LKTSVASYTAKKNAIQILYISNNKRPGFTSLKQRLIGYDDHFNEIVQEITFLNAKCTLFIINIAKIIFDNENISLILKFFDF